MLSDLERIQGLWKVVSVLHKGSTVGYGPTHWEFDGNRVQEIDPHYVYGGSWVTFALDPTTTPKRIDTTHEVTNREGEIVRRTFKECYELDGDTLRIGGAQIFGEYPEAVSDQISTVTTLTRYHGSRPETKQPSGKQPIDNPVLGVLTWNDDREQWEAAIELLPGLKVDISLSPDGKGDEETIASGQAFIEWIKSHEQEAREYAAREMTELAEDWRDEDEEPDEITPESFANRITLEAISMGAGGEATLWYDDGNLFAGHVVVVSVSPSREFTDAEMMG